VEGVLPSTAAEVCREAAPGITMVLRMHKLTRIPIITALALILADTCTADSAKKVKLKGHMVDVSCSIEQKDDLEYMRNSHSKGCFQMPACEKSGYAILTADDKVIRFDAKGNEIAKQLIQSANKDKDWRITVRGKSDGELISVSKIELEK
jgi:hypothetical protein